MKPLESLVSAGRSVSRIMRDLPENTLEGVKYLGSEIVDIPGKVKRNYVNVKNLTLEDWKGIGRNYRKELALSAVSTTAILAVSSPIQVFADTWFAEILGIVSAALNHDYLGNVVDAVEKYVPFLPKLRLNQLTAMTDEKSIGGKLGMALVMYGGFGLIYDKVRLKSRDIFKIPEPTTDEIKKRSNRHDFLFTFAYSSAMMTLGYHIFGEHDTTKLWNAVFVNFLTQKKRGPWIGAAVDMSKDLTGFKECKRIDYPQCIKNLGRWSKAGVFLAGVATSVALMFGEYSTTPKEWDNPHRQVERWNLFKYLGNSATK